MTVKALAVGLLLGLISVSPKAEDKLTASAQAVFLHFKWNNGALTMVERKEIPARLKASRKSSRTPGMPGKPGDFVYRLLGPQGDTLLEKHVQDPGLVRVEIQEPGDTQLRSYSKKTGSGDIFVRITDPRAKSIRFWRFSPRPVAGPLSKGVAGPELPPSEIPLGEFPL